MPIRQGNARAKVLLQQLTAPFILRRSKKEVTPEQRETLDKMIERLEEFDDVQTVYTNMQPEEGEE